MSQDIYPRWIDSHSVNCINCNVLFDEREGITPDSGEGTLCLVCANELELSQDEVMP